MTAVDDSERKLFFEEQVRSLLLKHIAEFHSGKAPRHGSCLIHKTDASPVLFGFQRFHQLVVVLLQDGAEQNFHLFSLEAGNKTLLTLILLPNERKHRNFR